MRLVFMGSPDFAVPALRALHEAGHTIAAAYCQPPRPAGRGQSVRPCPVHRAAQDLGIPVRTPARLRNAIDAQQDFQELRLEAAVVAAYGLILPQAMLQAPTRGCLNIHASLLPRWRGAAPIQAAIMAGDRQTGITIMQMDVGLDTGAMLLQEAVPIAAETTCSALHDQLAAVGSRLIVAALATCPTPVPQNDAEATYAPKLTKSDGRIDWTQSAEQIDRQIRAFNPWPGTFTTLAGTTLAGAPLKILGATPTHGHGPPGTVLDASLSVACGVGALRVHRVQLAGRAAMDTAAFLRGHPVPFGTVLGT